MNKQELIKHFEEMEYVSIVQMGKKAFIDMFKQLDESQKPVVPQFVADWYEENKVDFETKLFRAVESFSAPYEEDDPTEFLEWLVDGNNKPIQTLVNMHQFGYTIEKEKQYYVRFKFIEDSYSYLTLIKHLNAWTLSSIKLDKKFRTEHTKKQLEEAGFGWVFDCEGIEIEEVTE